MVKTWKRSAKLSYSKETRDYQAFVFASGSHEKLWAYAVYGWNGSITGVVSHFKEAKLRCDRFINLGKSQQPVGATND